MSEDIRHPIFARLYARISESAEKRGAADHRARLLAGLSGPGHRARRRQRHELPHYPTTVTEVIAVEPEPHLRQLAQQEAARASVSIRVAAGVADELPAEDASVDAGIASLVLCSVPDQARALAELHRVIRPGGELRFYEHVVSRNPIEARVQRALDATIYPALSGNDHLSRDTGKAIERAGFVIETCDRFRFSPAALLPPDDHILGTARRP